MATLSLIYSERQTIIYKKTRTFAKLKKSGRTEFLTLRKRTCPGKTERMATLHPWIIIHDIGHVKFYKRKGKLQSININNYKSSIYRNLRLYEQFIIMKVNP